MDFVQLTICWNAEEALAIKKKLEAAGISCFLQGGSILSLELGNSSSIPILVRPEDLDSANTYLNAKESKKNYAQAAPAAPMF